MDNETLREWTIDFINEMLLAGATYKQLSDVFHDLGATLTIEALKKEENNE